MKSTKLGLCNDNHFELLKVMHKITDEVALKIFFEKLIITSPGFILDALEELGLMENENRKDKIKHMLISFLKERGRINCDYHKSKIDYIVDLILKKDYIKASENISRITCLNLKVTDQFISDIMFN